MTLFNKSGNAQQLQKDSGKILDVFTRTVDSLKAINEVADSSISENERKKAEIDKELVSLNEVKTKNSVVIDKIEKLFTV